MKSELNTEINMRVNIQNTIAEAALGTTLALGLHPVMAQQAPTPAPIPEIAADAPEAMPMGQIDATKPVEVILMNNSATLLSVGFPGMANIKIEPAEQIEIAFETIPARLFIYPFSETGNVQYMTDVSGNTISVEVVPYTGEAPGDRAFNIDPLGQVYIY
jgi:hypothetical protein